MLHEILGGIGQRIPGHVEEEGDGIFHRLEVAHVEYPKFIHTVLIGQVELFPHALDGGHVQPFRITGSAYVVYVVVHAKATGMLAFFGIGQTAYVAPVVVAKQHDDVVGHAHTLIVIVEHFLVERPYLRCLLGGSAGDFLDDAALVVDNVFEQFHVGVLAHGFVAIATHTDGHHVFGAFHAFDALAEELVDDFFIGRIVPGTVLLALACPLLMVACHRFVVRSADDDAHLVGQLAVLGVVGIESPAPHGRPQEVAAQTENEFEHLSVELVSAVIGAEGVLHPSGQAGCLVVQEDATIGHRRLTVGIDTGTDADSLAGRYRHVGPPVPGRYTHLARQLVDAVDGTALVAAGNEQHVAFDSLKGCVEGGDDVFLAGAFQLFLVQLLGFYQLFDEGTFIG